MVWGEEGGSYNYNWFQKKSCYVLSTQIAITVIYTCNMFVLFCACDLMNVLSVQKMKKTLHWYECGSKMVDHI
jgi:hypothetical protein